MENTDKKEEPGFKLKNLFLLESNFKRETIVTFDESKVEQAVNINVQVQIEGSICVVTETLDYSQKVGDTIEVAATINMVGLFERIGEPPIDFESFGYVNGAAIIFPYIREQLSSLSVKAGLGLILLPPMNFTKNKIPIKK